MNKRKYPKTKPPKYGVIQPLFPDYIGTTDGRVYSKLVNRYLRGCVGSSGYPQLWLKTADGNLKWVALHRFIADCFLPKEENKPYVHHKNSDRLDAQISNLERVDQKTNMRYASAAGRLRRKKGADHHQFGRKLSDATKEKMAAGKVGLRNHRCGGLYYLSGFEAQTLRELSELTGRPLFEIRRLNKSGELKAHGNRQPSRREEHPGQKRLAEIFEREQRPTLSI